jgi:hypothetical protein
MKQCHIYRHLYRVWVELSTVVKCAAIVLVLSEIGRCRGSSCDDTHASPSVGERISSLSLSYTMPRPIIAPSVLASDFGQLTAECKRMIKGGAEWLHMGTAFEQPL